VQKQLNLSKLALSKVLNKHGPQQQARCGRNGTLYEEIFFYFHQVFFDERMLDRLPCFDAVDGNAVD
jgi:hypothetical protein